MQARRATELFGFTYSEAQKTGAGIAIVSPFSLTNVIKGMAYAGIPFLERYPVSSVATLEITGGATPTRVIDEQLSYKAAAPPLRLCKGILWISGNTFRTNHKKN